MNIKELTSQDIEQIKLVILETFSKDAWNDDWRDQEQFHSYILDLIDNKNSLSLGLYEKGKPYGSNLS